MLQSLLVVIVVLPFAFAVDADVTDEECDSDDFKITCRCEENQNYSAVVLEGDPNRTELTISGCANVDLGPGFFILDHTLKKITFRNIGRLVVQATFPSQLRELHVDGVGVVSLSKENFFGDTRLEHLRIHNSTIHQIKSDTFENVAVEKAYFDHVNFLSLEDDALAFSLNMSEENKTDRAQIHFNHCQFPDLDVDPISVAAPGKISFDDNILNCTDLARTYLWLDQMVREQKKRLCDYLDKNFCESKKDSNKLIRRLLSSGLLSKQIGLKLDDSCPEEHKEYLDSISGTQLNTGWMMHANFAILLSGFAMILLGV